MEENQDELIVPQKHLGDHLREIADETLGSIPGMGPAAKWLIQKNFVPKYQQRADNFVVRLASEIERLKARPNITPEDLLKDEGFLDSFAQAAQAAARTSQKVKLDALKNAVLNSAIPGRPQDTMRQIFIAMVDAFSDVHLRILTLLENPPHWYETNGRAYPTSPPHSFKSLIIDAFPDLNNQGDVIDFVGQELFSKQLIIVKQLRDAGGDYPMAAAWVKTNAVGSGGMPGIGPEQYEAHDMLRANWTTSLGKQFIEFITIPELYPEQFK